LQPLPVRDRRSMVDANGQPLPAKPRHTDSACHFLCAERRQRLRG